MLRRLLELSGHEVHEAADGPSGLERALRLAARRRADRHRAARLRRLRGGAAPARARRGAAIHLVALTGYGQPDDRRQAFEAGFDAHLVKPVEPEALLAACSGHSC